MGGGGGQVACMIVRYKGMSSELEGRDDAPIRDSFIQLFVKIGIYKIRGDWSVSDDDETGGLTKC